MAENKNMRPRGMVRGPHRAGSGEKAKNFKKSFARLLKYMKPYLPSIILSIILATIGTFLVVFAPKQLSRLTELLVTGTFEWSDINREAIIYLCLIFAAVIITIVQHWIMAGINTKICRKLRGEISEKTNKMPLSYFDKNSYGDILSRITNDVDMIASNLNNSITTIITSVLTIVCVPIFMFTICWQMTLIPLASVPVTLLFMIIIIAISQKYFVSHMQNVGKVESQIEEIFSATLVVKVFNAQKRENAKFNRVNTALFQTSYKSNFISGLLHPITQMVTNFSYVLCCVVAAILLVEGAYPISFIAQVPIFLSYIRQFNNPLQQISQISSSLQSTVAASERVFEYLDEPEQEDESAKTAKIDNFNGKIEFKNVKFGYLPDKTIINNLSFVAEPGQKIAIVGPTGAGKTTIVNLIMRFYEIDQGEILIDGTNTKDLKREDVRTLFAMVLQDTWLFDGTIRENLTYGRPAATEEEIKEACMASNIWHFIKTLPGGLDYRLDEKSSLSAGQKQLFTIARAMVQNAPMLILDEATSNVDTRTEEVISEAMDKLAKNKTSFVIAHRLSTIKNADLILLLDGGDVVEQGSHQELIKQNGKYAELYNAQFSLENQ